jgi:sugar O-acyltransferase (sialic acid O-acetyltransferase NeuD family)
LTNFIFGTGAHATEISELMKFSELDSPIFLSEIEEKNTLDMVSGEAKSLYLGVGYPEARLRILNNWKKYELDFRILCHRYSYISNSAIIKPGCVLQFGSVLSSESTLESGVLLNWNVSVGHHAFIGKGSVINPAASISGNCHIGSGVLIGTGARVLEGITIASGTIIGAGAVVTQNIPVAGTYVGIPARPLR